MLDIKLFSMKKTNISNKNPILWLVSFCFLLISSLINGQIKQKRQLTADNYDRWSTLWPKKISDKGEWASYALQYEQHQDTLFVKQTEGNVKYVFPNGHDGIFNKEEWFACQMRDTLALQNLIKDTIQYTPNVSSFTFTSNGKFLLLFFNDSQDKKRIVIKNMQGQIVESIPNISSWKIDSSGNSIVYCTNLDKQYSVGMIHFGKQIIKESIIYDNAVGFQNLVWRGNIVAFTQKGTLTTKLFCYNTRNKKLLSYNPEGRENFPLDMRISDAYGSLTLSDDGQRVFFLLKENNTVTKKSETAVQIWNTEDKQLYENRKNYGFSSLRDKLAVWWPQNNRILQITSKELPSAMLNGDYKYALTFDPLGYEPQSKFNSERDIYITDLSTGKRKLLLEKHSGDILTLIMSPNGKYISYPKGGNWWIYDISKESHTNITGKMGVHFFREDNNTPGEAQMYGNPGWTENDKAIYLYDQFDIWEISPDGTSNVRLTHGREKKLRFRINPLPPEQQFSESFFDFATSRFNSNDTLVLEAYDKHTETSGYYLWNRKNGESPLVQTGMKTTHFIKAARSEAFVYLEQNYQQAPRLVFQSNYKNKQKELVQSNQQQENFYWGKSELVSYMVDGKRLLGALFYPAEYQKRKQYPMIVQIYERQSHYVNNYVNPSVYEQGGFNITNFTTQGYFVLLPDIAYQFGDTGASATACVIAATDEMIKRGFADPSKLGLIGHSFGGYETDFIITQTDKFATAVSGAAWTDLVSTYFYIGESYLKPEFWRFEDHQLRIGKSLFEDPSSYIKNSPILQAANVRTPLLAWVGAKDRTIDSYQSIEFYLALRKLKKRHTLLIYPSEDHALLEENNQKDLTMRIKEWFDYYLKNKKRETWMEANNP
jgi:dipeptidyl aminopeptidase/acylaminoacyl peptidase